MILALCTYADVHADAVLRVLQDRNAEFVRLCTTDLGTEADLQWLSSADASDMTLTVPGRTVSISDITAVWQRRAPRPPRVGEQSTVEHFVSMQARSLYDELMSVLQGKPAINPGPQDDRADSRIVHLRAATECGLDVPATLISRDPEAVRTFATSHPDLVAKPLRADGVLADGQYAFAGTFRCDIDVITDDAIRLNTNIYQAAVDKVNDIRVIVVGSEIFAAELPSEADDPIDYRMTQAEPGGLEGWIPYVLPDPVREGLLALLAELELEFCSADFALDRNGKHYFLDLNPGGQWLWIQNEAGLDIATALATRLIELSRK